jgi:UPF0271 protein
MEMVPSISVDLNADLGEGFPWDEALLDLVTSASISCGAHAGDEITIRRTLGIAKARGTLVGAHPGYPDREHFGRREQAVSRSETYGLVRRQVDHLEAIADAIGIKIRFLKPHGALYNQAVRSSEIARAVVDVALESSLLLVGQGGSEVEKAAAQGRVNFIREGFVDRRYQVDGRLVPRAEPGAMLEDPAEISAQVRRLVKDGVQTLCIHGDNPNCVALARFVRDTLEEAGVAVRDFARHGDPR